MFGSVRTLKNRKHPKPRFAPSTLGQTSPWALEPKSLAAPAFYQATPYFDNWDGSGWPLEAGASSTNILGAPLGQSTWIGVGGNGTAGAGATSILDYTDPDPDGVDYVRAQEQGIVTSQVTGPTSGSSNTAAFSINVSHAHTDHFETTGEYAFNSTDFDQYTNAYTNGFLHYVVQDPSNPTLAGDTATVSFTASMTPPQNGFVDGFALDFRSPYLNVTGGDPNGPTLGTGITATNPSTGTVMASNANFGAESGVSTFTVQFTVPASAAMDVFYNSQFFSGIDGDFVHTTLTQQPFFTWSFTTTLNPPAS